MFEVETAFVLLFGTWEKRQIPVCSWRWWPRVAEILSSNDWGNVGRALWKAGLWEGSAVWEDLRAWQKARAVMRRWGEKGWEPLIPMSPKYPPRLWRRLGWRAPALLWGKGCKEFMGSPGVAIVGSRELNEEEEEFAEAVGMICARLGFKVVSGGARGADQSGSQGCVEAGGFAVHFLPGGKSEDGVCGHGLLTIDPAEGVFDRVLALQRNRWIYSSSEAGVVVSSRFKAGGAWSGAMEALRGRLCPLLVYTGRGSSEGNKALSRLGAHGVSCVDEVEGFLRRLRISGSSSLGNLLLPFIR